MFTAGPRDRLTYHTPPRPGRSVAREPRDGPLALGATTDGDPYVMAGPLGELVLLEMGWRVRQIEDRATEKLKARAEEQGLDYRLSHFD
jgi:hypothetical protein